MQKQKNFKILDRVRLVVSGTSVPAGLTGRVVQQDFQRSIYSHDTQVVWKRKLGRKFWTTWTCSWMLEPVTTVGGR